ncbi:YdeI/OmpD-associated family protein [Paenibacillus cymbidii]|uniref:YdeI/OmpD-associated family protein n=1 Tax=Paenibacillus cymbidii TaxID=1639034 RepID=UPI001436A909|nr:YdeI/OmpD-associated family protein [Paenibacillus cymbidii]
METYRFEVTLVRPEAVGAWTYVVIPFDVESAFAVKGRVSVCGDINGCAFRSSLLPQGNGSFFMVVNRAIRDRIGAAAGATVSVTLMRDDGPRDVETPDDLAEALEANGEAAERFARMSYSHRKEYVDWIESAKKAETRQSRISKAVGMIAGGTRLK